MQYCIIINDIALLMHYRALLQMPDMDIGNSVKHYGNSVKSKSARFLFQVGSSF